MFSVRLKTTVNAVTVPCTLDIKISRSVIPVVPNDPQSEASGLLSIT